MIQMNGVTIIEEHLCRVVELPQLIAICIFFTFICFAVLAFYRWAYKDTKKKSTRIMAICCSIAVVVMCIVLWTVQIRNYNDTHFEYTVKVDDSVGFNDFLDRYEIISVDGDEYRVKEINNES